MSDGGDESGSTGGDTGGTEKPEKPRVVVLSDVSNEPDDQMSLVRLLLYTDVIDLEAIVAGTSCWRQSGPDADTVHRVIEAYGQVEDNLRLHSAEYPTAESLHALTFAGVDGYGMSAAAEQLDIAAIDHLIAVVDAPDPRPVWFLSWGGGNTLGGAVMKVKRDRTREEAAAFVAKIRGYEIALQDDAQAYVAHEFPEAFLIANRVAWKGISRTTPGFGAWPESWGGDDSAFDAAWVSENVQHDHGPLGEQYPDGVYLYEGDTPSLLYVLPTGLGDPEYPHHGS
jgi:hypothetical protein